MDLIEAIKARKSIRGYKSTSVPKEILAEILETSTRSPSGDNCQPWEFAILGGKVLEELKTTLQERFLAGVAAHPDFSRQPFIGIYKNRASELNQELFHIMNIGREDTQKKNQWNLKMLRAYDAPNLILVYTEAEALGIPRAVFGVGALSQTIALMALNFKLGTCLLGSITNYPDVVRNIVDIPISKTIIVGIAIGYPDWDYPANQLHSTRDPIDKISKWMGI